jgi:hypothetical protein
LAAVALTVLVGGCGSASTTAGAVPPGRTNPASGSIAGSATPTPPELTADVLASVAKRRIFFAHRSVGGNIVVDGLPAVYRSFHLTPPVVNPGLPRPEGSFGDSWLNQTDDPQSKLDDFEAWVRTKGVGQAADVAFMKLGYLDVNDKTDVPALFAKYRSMMAGLERDFPNVTFLHVTITVTQWRPEDNAAYERFNQLMRMQYGGTGRLVDLARVLSTRPDGARVEHHGDVGVYYTLYEGYASDGGHLNALGAQVAAMEMLRTIAGARA